MGQEHRVSYKVYYEDTDSLRVVYHADYLKFLERGHSKFVGSLGPPNHDWIRNGYNFVVYELSMKFKRSARLGDLLEVVTSFRLDSAYRGRFSQRPECTEPVGRSGGYSSGTRWTLSPAALSSSQNPTGVIQSVTSRSTRSSGQVRKLDTQFILLWSATTTILSLEFSIMALLTLVSSCTAVVQPRLMLTPLMPSTVRLE